MQMLGKRVYLRVVDPSKTESGITIDITNKEKPDRGEVVHVGKDVEELEPGDNVIFDKNVGKFVWIEGEKLWLIREDSVFMKY